jgi:hypothetical protein
VCIPLPPPSPSYLIFISDLFSPSPPNLHHLPTYFSLLFSFMPPIASVEERKQLLDDDPDISVVEPHRVLCRLCDTWHKLRSYDPQPGAATKTPSLSKFSQLNMDFLLWFLTSNTNSTARMYASTAKSPSEFPTPDHLSPGQDAWLQSPHA